MSDVPQEASPTLLSVQWFAAKKPHHHRVPPNRGKRVEISESMSSQGQSFCLDHRYVHGKPFRSSLDDHAGSSRGHVARVWSSLGLNEQNVGLFLGHRAVLHALGHYVHLAWPKLDAAVTQQDG